MCHLWKGRNQSIYIFIVFIDNENWSRLILFVIFAMNLKHTAWSMLYKSQEMVNIQFLKLYNVILWMFIYAFLKRVCRYWKDYGDFG